MTVQELIASLERDFHFYRSQCFTHFTFGYAEVKVSKDLRTLTLRREGGEDEQISLPPDCQEAYPLCLETLRTGRTVLCGAGVNLPVVPRFYGSMPTTVPLKSLVHSLTEATDRRPTWDLNPSYQRGSVWTPEHQSLFIGHVLSGGIVPPIYVQRYETQKNVPRGVSYVDLPEEVLDGKQRCLAWLAFYRGDIGATLDDGKVLFYRDFNEVERRDSRLDLRVVFLDLSYEERLKFYLRLNSGGVPHTQEELDRVKELLRAAQSA